MCKTYLELYSYWILTLMPMVKERELELFRETYIKTYNAQNKWLEGPGKLLLSANKLMSVLIFKVLCMFFLNIFNIKSIYLQHVTDRMHKNSSVSIFFKDFSRI